MGRLLMNGVEIDNWLFWTLGVLVLVGVIGHLFVYRILLELTKRTKSVIDNLCIKHCYRPIQWIVVLLIIHLILPVKLSEEYLLILKQAMSLLLIALISFLLVKATYVLDEYVIGRFKIDEKDNLRARKLRTKKGRETYSKRKTIVEPEFGQIKRARGFVGFSLRGTEKMRGEWSIVCLTHNLLKLFRVQYAVVA